MTLEGSQSQQLPGGINFSRLSPVELLGNLLGDKNTYICRGQAEKRGLHGRGRRGRARLSGEAATGRGRRGLAAGARPEGSRLPPQPSATLFCPRGAAASPMAAVRWPGLLPTCQAAPLSPQVPLRNRHLPELGGAELGAGHREPPGLWGAVPAEPPRSHFAPPGANRSAC